MEFRVKPPPEGTGPQGKTHNSRATCAEFFSPAKPIDGVIQHIVVDHLALMPDLVLDFTVRFMSANQVRNARNRNQSNPHGRGESHALSHGQGRCHEWG